jgi:hypothetical protein
LPRASTIGAEPSAGTAASVHSTALSSGATRFGSSIKTRTSVSASIVAGSRIAASGLIRTPPMVGSLRLWAVGERIRTTGLAGAAVFRTAVPSTPSSVATRIEARSIAGGVHVYVPPLTAVPPSRDQLTCASCAVLSVYGSPYWSRAEIVNVRCGAPGGTFTTASEMTSPLGSRTSLNVTDWCGAVPAACVTPSSTVTSNT